VRNNAGRYSVGLSCRWLICSLKPVLLSFHGQPSASRCSKNVLQQLQPHPWTTRKLQGLPFAEACNYSITRWVNNYFPPINPSELNPPPPSFLNHPSKAVSLTSLLTFLLASNNFPSLTSAYVSAFKHCTTG
jgi:hypothetical protein